MTRPTSYMGRDARALPIDRSGRHWDRWVDELQANIRVALVESGISVREIARTTGRAEASIHRMISRRIQTRRADGRRIAPRMESVFLIARACGVPISSLLPDGGL